MSTTNTDARIRWHERSDNTAILRPCLDGVAVDPEDPGGQDWQMVVKALGGDGLDDDSGAVLTVGLSATPNGSVLAIVPDPNDPTPMTPSLTKVFQVTVVEADMPAPDIYQYRLDRLAPSVNRWGPARLDVANV